ncbi:MAG: winged helix-turn-helix domain-containing protein [Clostridiales bacterium]|jgi:DNA-binding transcriptional regulator YhcF (GntR family)|nr:winged helix-turn-helix domain-containing protein [Clostridiales bacterium]
MREFTSITLNKDGDVPVYRQLGEALCALIQEGVFKPYRKLPPIRVVARALRINNDTVINAYKYMEVRGAVYSIVGSGTYVSVNSWRKPLLTPERPCFRLPGDICAKTRPPYCR